MDNKKGKAIDTAKAFLEGQDMSSRESEVLRDIIARTNFLPKGVLWRSDYYGTGKLGAIHYLGKFKDKKAVLKIQGVKPETSEIEMIRAFSGQNESLVIRAPRLFESLAWNEKLGYEALIMEHIEGEKIIKSGSLQTQDKVGEFFNLYQEYKNNCINKPWLAKPQKENFLEVIRKAKTVAQKVKPDSPYRREEDLELVDKGSKKLEAIWQNKESEFMHGHFSAEDLIKKGNKVVLFSNLFWKWKPPFYDAVFAYHWFIYSLSGITRISKEKIDSQRNIWLDQIYNLSLIRSSKNNRMLINAVLLERALAGLLVDAFAYIEETNPIAEYMVISTREEARRLTEELN